MRRYDMLTLRCAVLRILYPTTNNNDYQLKTAIDATLHGTQEVTEKVGSGHHLFF